MRTEIATALERGIRVIPVLLGGATMPSQANLPEDIFPLTRRNAIEIRHSHFDADVAGLINVLSKLVSPKQEDSTTHSTAVNDREIFVKARAKDDKSFRKPRWLGRIAIFLFFIIFAFFYLNFLDSFSVRSSSSSGYRTVRQDDALMVASVTTVLALIITYVAARSGSRRWWLSMVVGIPAFAVLGFGVGNWLAGGLRVRGDGALVGAIAIWIMGFLVIVGPVLLKRRRSKADAV